MKSPERLHCGFRYEHYRKNPNERWVCMGKQHWPYCFFMDTGCGGKSYIRSRPPKLNFVYENCSIPSDDTLMDHYWTREILKNNPYVPYDKRPKSLSWDLEDWF